MEPLFINSLCQKLSPVLVVVGNVLWLFKILVPFVLIVLGTFDIGKSIITNKKDDSKKYFKTFFKRIAVSISLFFIPLFVMIIFNFVEGFNDAVNNSGIDFDVCYDCLFNPRNGKCANNVND